MRKAIIITSLVLSGLMILDSMNVGQAFVMFLLAGQVPGTDLIISAGTMMEMFALLTGFVLARIINHFALILMQRFPIRLAHRA